MNTEKTFFDPLEFVNFAISYGYTFPEHYEKELERIILAAQLDWFNTTDANNGDHPNFESFDECMGLYIEGFYNQSKLY